MIRKLGIRKTTAVAASLLLASATMFATAASAQKWPPRDPVCDQQVTDACAIFWQQLGYGSAQQCANVEKCYQCPPNYGYMCGVGLASKPDEATRPW